MDALTIAEALELIRVNEEAMVTQFETWLTITFATIVAVFVGRNLLSRLMRWLVTILYLLASLSVIAMSIYFAESNAQLTLLLESRGVTVVAPVFAALVFFLLFVAGVSTTVYFIHMKPDRETT
ncbi:hypothetical protein [Elongatibacter sediminis]|uniref:Uncharacterized protein n=1 Tax=Elongatibacter sediminis TaxID=3119006 RepID=A0AAW9RGJ2_9GAMM